MKKCLVIVRHAHRDKIMGGIFDNGLSTQGKAQARRFAKEFAKEFGKNAKPMILSSPKKRCLETVHPLSKQSGADLKTMPLLDEGSVEEKAEKFLAWWRKKAP